MDKRSSVFTSILFCLLLSCVFLTAQEMDISGTWVGTTYVPDMPEPDEVSLVLEKDNGSYIGTISDSMGMAQEAECEDIVFEDDTLTFTFMVFTGYEFMAIDCTLMIEGDTMTGYWEGEDGSMGDLELERVYE